MITGWGGRSLHWYIYVCVYIYLSSKTNYFSRLCRGKVFKGVIYVAAFLNNPLAAPCFLARLAKRYIELELKAVGLPRFLCFAPRLKSFVLTPLPTEPGDFTLVPRRSDFLWRLWRWHCSRRCLKLQPSLAVSSPYLRLSLSKPFLLQPEAGVWGKDAGVWTSPCIPMHPQELEHPLKVPGSPCHMQMSKFVVIMAWHPLRKCQIKCWFSGILRENVSWLLHAELKHPSRLSWRVQAALGARLGKPLRKGRNLKFALNPRPEVH